MLDKFSPEYNKRIIDLSAPIEKHWRYPISIEDDKAFDKGNLLNIKHFDMKTHWYTHIDAPLHYVDKGRNLDEFPLENLMGKALVLDLSGIGPNEAITAKMLQNAAEGLPMQSIILIRTDWAKKVAWETREYWTTAPYFTDEAAILLRKMGPKVVGFDFPQDKDIRHLANLPEGEADLTTHKHILAHGIQMMEYLTNLWLLPTQVVDFIALPVGLKNADGAQIRAIAVV